MVHFGLQCASWVRTSAGSTRRCILAPMGDSNAKSVQSGNFMGARQGVEFLQGCTRWACVSGFSVWITFSRIDMEVHHPCLRHHGQVWNMDFRTAIEFPLKPP